MTTKWIEPRQCIPMPELERAFYDQSNYFYLKRTISRDGYNPAYPVRAIYNRKLKKNEVFDGIHRIKVSQDLGLDFIPIIIEDIARAEAIAEGYKANRTHAWYNTMDKAKHLEALANEFKVTGDPKYSREKTVGRPGYLHKVSEKTGEDVNIIKRHLRLLKLPDSVQQMIGKGNLSYTSAVEICKLLGTEKEHLIPGVAEKAQNMTKRETASYVEAILKGVHHPFKACDLCGKGYPKERISWMKFCPQCTKKLRNGYFESENVEPVSEFEDSETPFMDYVNRLEEINEVREKLGLEPLKGLKPRVVEREVQG